MNDLPESNFSSSDYFQNLNKPRWLSKRSNIHCIYIQKHNLIHQWFIFLCISVSLAFADMITGLLLLFSVIPNLDWVRNSTESMIIEELMKAEENRSATAIIEGSMLTFTAQVNNLSIFHLSFECQQTKYIFMQASLLHLSFMSLERFIAIKWPLWHRRRRTKTILLTIAGIWIVSLLFAFAPGKIPSRNAAASQVKCLTTSML